MFNLFFFFFYIRHTTTIRKCFSIYCVLIRFCLYKIPNSLKFLSKYIIGTVHIFFLNYLFYIIISFHMLHPNTKYHQGFVQQFVFKWNVLGLSKMQVLLNVKFSISNHQAEKKIKRTKILGSWPKYSERRIIIVQIQLSERLLFFF